MGGMTVCLRFHSATAAYAVAVCAFCALLVPAYSRIEIVNVVKGYHPTYVSSFGMLEGGVVNTAFILNSTSAEAKGTSGNATTPSVNVTLCSSEHFQYLFHSSTYSSSSYIGIVLSSDVRNFCDYTFPAGSSMVVPESGLFFVFAYGDEATVNVTMLNPGNLHLDAGEKPLPTIMRVSTIVWLMTALLYIVSVIIARRHPVNMDASRQPVVILTAVMLLHALASQLGGAYWTGIQNTGTANNGLSISQIVFICVGENLVFGLLYVMSKHGVFLTATKMDRRVFNVKTGLYTLSVLVVLLLDSLYDTARVFFYCLLVIYLLLFQKILGGSSKMNIFFKIMFRAYNTLHIDPGQVTKKIKLIRCYKIIGMTYTVLIYLSLFPATLFSFDHSYVPSLLREISGWFILSSLACITHPCVFRNLDLVTDLFLGGSRRHELEQNRQLHISAETLQQMSHPYIVQSPGKRIFAAWEKQKKRARKSEQKPGHEVGDEVMDDDDKDAVPLHQV